MFQLALYGRHAGVSSQWLVWTKQARWPGVLLPPLLSTTRSSWDIHLHARILSSRERRRRRASAAASPRRCSTAARLYHYQLVPLVGTVFFPTHFLSFLHWYHAQLRTPTTACTPTLISNRWYQSDPTTHWGSAWLSRFTFESGWYALHTNWHSTNTSHGLKPKGLLIDVTPLASHLTVLLIKRLGTRERELPPPAELRLYDFHFKEYRLDRRMLGWRRTVFPPQGVVRGEWGGMGHEEEVRRGEEVRRRRDGGGGGGGGGEGDGGGMDGHAEEGLWARLERYKARVVDIGDVGTMHAHSHSSSDASAVGREEGGEAEGDGEVEVEVESEVGVSATELIIDMMVLAMASEADEADSSNINAVIDARAYQAQVERIQRKVSRSLSGIEHLHSTPRNPHNLSRCFTIDQLADIEALHADYMSPLASPLTPTLPSPYALYPGAGDIAELYPLIYHRLTSALLSPPKPGAAQGAVPADVRFIVYSPSKLVPFDRHLRGVYFCFLVAVVTERILLIDLPEFHTLYASPFPSATNLTWDYHAFSPLLANRQLTSATLDPTEVAARLRTDDLNDIFPQHVLRHVDGVSHDRLMFKNRRYAQLLPALFASYSRMRRTGAVMRLLLSRPRPAFAGVVGAVMPALLPKPTPKYTVCVHLVPQVASQGVLGLGEAHWGCVVSTLIHQGWPRDDTAIIVSAGKRVEGMKEAVTAKMSGYGTVLMAQDAWGVWTGNGGQCNATVNASRQVGVGGGEGGGGGSVGGVEYDPYLVDLYVFGECDVSVSSGTTYGIFGAARTGFSRRAFTFKAAPPPVKGKNGTLVASTEEDYCGPMHRLDLPQENDINF